MSGALCQGYLCEDKPQNLIFGNGGECEHAIDNVGSRQTELFNLYGLPLNSMF